MSIKARTIHACDRSAAQGLYAELLPPRKLGLRDLVIRAIETDAAFRDILGKGSSISDAEYLRRDEAAFDARADLRAHLMNLGLDKALIDQLGAVL